MRDLLVGASVVADAHPAQPREEPPLLTSVSGHPLVSVIDHPLHQGGGVLRASLLAADQPQAHPTSERRWQHSTVTRYRACHRLHLLPPAGRPGFPLAGTQLGGVP
jgi:hypothetical protein